MIWYVIVIKLTLSTMSVLAPLVSRTSTILSLVPSIANMSGSLLYYTQLKKNVNRCIAISTYTIIYVWERTNLRI